MNFRPIIAIAVLIVSAGLLLAGSFQDNTTGNGRVIGSANDKLAFHDATPVVQRSGSAQAALATNVVLGSNVSLSGIDGSTNTVFLVNTNQMTSTLKLLIEIRAALVEKGLIKGQ